MLSLVDTLKNYLVRSLSRNGGSAKGFANVYTYDCHQMIGKAIAIINAKSVWSLCPTCLWDEVLPSVFVPLLLLRVQRVTPGSDKNIAARRKLLSFYQSDINETKPPVANLRSFI